MARPKKVKSTRKSKPIPKAAAAPGRVKKAADRANANAKALFLDHHLPMIAKLRDQLQSANAKLRNAYKTAKTDGYMKRDFETAFKLKSQLGEREMRAEIARNLTIANWLGFGLGKQLDLFMEDEPADVEENAFAAGEEASRDDQPAQPLHAPGTPGYDAYMRGYHEHQETITQGFKPTSGTPMTRSQFKAQQALKKAQAAKEAVEDAAGPPMFTKRTPDEAA